MQVRRDVMTQQRKEARNSERLIAISYYLKVNCVSVKVVGEERDEGIYGNHEEDSYDMPLFPWFQVVRTVAPDEVP